MPSAMTYAPVWRAKVVIAMSTARAFASTAAAATMLRSSLTNSAPTSRSISRPELPVPTSSSASLKPCARGGALATFNPNCRQKKGRARGPAFPLGGEVEGRLRGARGAERPRPAPVDAEGAVEREAAGAGEHGDHEAGDEREVELHARARLVLRHDQRDLGLDEDDRHDEVDGERHRSQAGQQPGHQQEATDELGEGHDVAHGRREGDAGGFERRRREARRTEVEQLLVAMRGHDEADEQAADEQTDAGRRAGADAVFARGGSGRRLRGRRLGLAGEPWCPSGSHALWNAPRFNGYARSRD